MEAIHINRGDVLIISDAHLCAGELLSNGKPNPNELFFSDHEFARLVKSWKRRNKASKRWLILNGDMIDYHAIPHGGSFRCVPTEEAALAETKACIKGHAKFFSALANFVATQLDDELVFTVGNHDLEFEWESVQEMLLDRIDPHGTNRHRIRFTREVRIGEDILVVHGDETDNFCRKPKKEHTFITGKIDPLPAILAAVVLFFTFSALIGVAKTFIAREYTFSTNEILLALLGFFALLSLVGAFIAKLFFGSIGKERVYLNHPTSTYMNSWLGQRLRARMPWIGRMQNHGAIWFLSVVHNWHFMFFALPAIFMYFSYHRFVIEVVDWRREHKKASFTFIETLKLLRSTMKGDQYETNLDQFIMKYPKVRHLIMGHTHVPEDRLIHSSERKFRYLNTGTMIRQVRLISPIHETEPLSWVKMFFWRIAIFWKKRPMNAIALTALHLILGPLAIWGLTKIGWNVSAGVILALTAFSLFWRQSYAQYRGEEFTEFTPVEISVQNDGTRSVQLMQYFPEEDKWSQYIEA